MRRWLVFLLLALFVTTGCASAGGSGAPQGLFSGGGGTSHKRPEPPPPPEARLGSGNAVAATLIDGGEILPTLLDALKQAKHRVDLEMYEFGHADLRDAVLAAAKRGVAVRVILDATEQQSQAMAGALQKAKVPVRLYQVPGGINHVKLLVADDSVVIGGMNWGKGSMLNHDYDVLIKQAPAEFATLFERDWQRAGGAAATGPKSDLLLYDAAIRTAFSQHLSDASRSVWLEMDELSDPRVIRGLIEARGRGLDVRVVLDPNVKANQGAAQELLAGKVEVRWYYTDVGRLHAKAILFDDAHFLVGSANLTYRGLSVNHEADIDLHAPELLGRISEAFDNDWKRAIPARPAAA